MNEERFEELDDTQRAAAHALRSILRGSERVDPLTASRLASARARAVAESTPARSGHHRWLWASGGLTAAAVAVAAILLQFGALQRFRGEPVESPQAEAIEVLTDDMDSDFYEDLDLYRFIEDDRA